MKTVWKFPMSSVAASFAMPEGAEILHVDLQGDLPCFWALVDPAKPTVSRSFRMVGTGHPINFPTDKFIGTFLTEEGKFVFHIFEIIPGQPDPGPVGWVGDQHGL